MGPQRLARADIGEISGKHAGYQLGRQQLFERLAIYSQLGKSRHELNKAYLRNTDRSLDLGEKSLRDQQKGLNWTIASGLLGTGFGVLEGQRRKKMLEESTKEQQLMRDYITTSNDAKRSALSGRTDDSALLAARSLLGRRFF
jgi:hypothetical protein